MTGSLGDFLEGLITFLAPGASVVGAAVLMGSPGGERITAAEWITACVAAVVTSAAIDARAARRGKPRRPAAADRDPRGGL